MGVGFGIRGSGFKGPNFSINIRSNQKLFSDYVLLSGVQDKVSGGGLQIIQTINLIKRYTAHIIRAIQPI